MAKRDYDVTVFATKDSYVEGCTMINIGKEVGTVNVDWLETERKAFEMAKPSLVKEYDIICDCTWFGHVYSLLGSHPEMNILHAHHGGLSWPPYGSPEYPEFLRNGKFNLISISKFMQRVYKEGVVKMQDGRQVGPLNFDSRVAYNGIDVEKYKFREEKGDRLLFVGRLDDFKNPKHAIAAAKQLRMPIDIVGGSFVYKDKYMEEVKQMAGTPECRLYMNAPDDLKILLMQNAKAEAVDVDCT